MVDILNMSNEELRDMLRKDILEANPDPEWERRLREYHDNIERDFKAEWSKRHFKWFFKKRRQRKLRAKIMRRYEGPIFWLIEDILEDLWPKALANTTDYFVDIKDIKGENPEWCSYDKPQYGLCASERVLRDIIANKKI